MARPFTVAVGDLVRHPGTQRHIAVVGPLPGLSISTARVPDESDVEADVMLEAQHDSLTATGTVRAHWEGECRRCLRPVAGVAGAHVQEVFERQPTEGETYALTGEEIDLEPMVRDSVLLALPLAPLCEEACPGPDPTDYPVVVAEEVTEPAEAPADPRWAPLAALHFDDDDSPGG